MVMSAMDELDNAVRWANMFAPFAPLEVPEGRRVDCDVVADDWDVDDEIGAVLVTDETSLVDRVLDTDVRPP